MSRLFTFALLVAIGPGVPLLAAEQAPAAKAAPAAASSCVTCHHDASVFEGKELEIPNQFAKDVHAAAGLGCQDCHGGNADAKLATDSEAAKNAKAPFSYVGAPSRADIPGFCGRCHSDPNYMKRFKPDGRTDQEQQYWSSRHGQLLKHGDTKVAVCTDCHGVHGIQPVASPDSTMYRTHIADTCASCHGDPKHMAGRKLEDGRPFPVDQYARWRQSVHAKSMLEKGDLSAPTCTDCHGSHGATPPGVGSIAQVCAQCHTREAQLFQASPKAEAFRSHSDLLLQSNGKGCVDCHASPDPSAAATPAHAFKGCITCHDNHGIVRPTVAMLSPLPKVPCTFCHEPGGPLGVEMEAKDKREHFEAVRDALLAEAKSANVSEADLFDWMVDRAVVLPFHTQDGPAGKAPEPKPEFQRLFTKFRIGKTYYTFKDPVSGKDVHAPVTRCVTCHGDNPTLGDAVGLKTSAEYLRRMQELTSLTARAERTALAANRGGVATQAVLPEIDAAVDSQIELEVLVHSFSSDKDGKFAKKHEEGVVHARAALTAAHSALNELSFRRQGLYVALGAIALLLIGLALKIRQMP